MQPEQTGAQGRLVRWAVGAAVALVLALNVPSGLVLRVHAWTSEGVFPEVWLERAYTVHSASGLACLPLLFAVLCLPRMGNALAERPSRGRTALTLVGVFLVVTLVLAIAALLLAQTFVETLLPWLSLFALALVLEPGTAGPARGALISGLLLSALAPLSFYIDIPAPAVWAARGSALGTLILLGVLVRGLRGHERPIGARGASLVAVLTLGAASLLSVLQHLDIMLSDTLFSVGILHLRLLGIACAALAQMIAPWRSRALGGIGIATISLSSAVFSGALVVLGLRGMPRHYASYLEDFLSLQRLATGAAASMVLGALLLALSALGAQRRISPVRPPS